MFYLETTVINPLSDLFFDVYDKMGLQNPKLPAELPFTDIPMWLCLLCFLAVEALAVAAAYVSVRRGQNKRHKEREELQSRPQ